MRSTRSHQCYRHASQPGTSIDSANIERGSTPPAQGINEILLSTIQNHFVIRLSVNLRNSFFSFSNFCGPFECSCHFHRGTLTAVLPRDLRMSCLFCSVVSLATQLHKRVLAGVIKLTGDYQFLEMSPSFPLCASQELEKVVLSPPSQGSMYKPSLM